MAHDNNTPSDMLDFAKQSLHNADLGLGRSAVDPALLQALIGIGYALTGILAHTLEQDNMLNRIEGDQQ